MTLDDNLSRFMDMSTRHFIAVDEFRVNIMDLIDSYPGRIVRCDGNPRDAIAFFYEPDEQIGVIAGWISEE